MEAQEDDDHDDDDDEDGDGDDGDIAVILRELPPPDVEEGWLGAKRKKNEKVKRIKNIKK